MCGQAIVLVRRELSRFRGEELDTAGDGFFAIFDGPARAISCARAIVGAVGELDLTVRAGVHTGECELQDGKVTGIAVNIGARVAAAADPARFSCLEPSKTSWQAQESGSRKRECGN